MSLVAVIAFVYGPIYTWFIGIWLGLVGTYGQLIGGILGMPFAWLSNLIFPFGL
jgi:hypothetical protein